MDTKKFKALVTAVEKGSFTNAADELGYTQSGLTHMINALESDLGFALLHRGHYGVRLTDDGQRLLPYITAFLDAGGKLASETENIRRHHSTTIKIGAYASIALQWLPAIMQEFQQSYPNINISVYQGSAHNIYSDTENGIFDVGFVSRRTDYSVDWIPLHNDPLLAILPKSHFGADPVPNYFDIKEFNGRRFLMPSLGFDQDIVPVFEQCGITPSIQPASVDDFTVISMVEHGLGVSMLSELVIHGYEDRVIALPLFPEFSRQLGIITRSRKTTSKAVKAFIACSQKIISPI